MAKRLEENKKGQEKEKNKRIAIIVAVVVLLLIVLLLLFLIRKEFTVTFDSNGGSEVAAVKVKENDKVEKPEDPTREGYVFGGWYYDKELYNFDTPVKQDMTLEAEWAVEGSTTNAVKGVKLNVESISLGINGAEALVAVVEPENATNPKVTWKSSDKSIVTVDENGNIKGLKTGTATITVTTEDGGFTATCTVTVTEEKAKDVAVTGVKISGANTATVGSTIKLRATVSPSNASNKKVTWSSSNKSIATVDANGNVKGLKEGKVTITVTTEDGGFKSTYTVTVKAKPTSTPKPTATQKPTQKPTSTPKPSQNPTNTPNPTQSPTNTPKPTQNPTSTPNPTQNPTSTPTPTQKPTSTPTPVEDKYVITLTARNTVVGVLQYEVSVTKNGSAVEYRGIKYNGKNIPKGNYIDKQLISEGIKEATVTLSDGTVKNATVNYSSRDV